jgi:hypothetical protein
MIDKRESVGRVAIRWRYLNLRRSTRACMDGILAKCLIITVEEIEWAP